jgi:DNA-directed RNA polymerase subunit RPC12/RpoP
VLAGSITDQPRLDASPIDGQCVECDAGLVVRYDEYAVVECPECGETVMWNEFPPAGLADRTPRGVAAAFDEWTRTRFRLAMEGICPSCAAGTTTEIVVDEDGDVSTTHRCENCRYEARAPLFGHVIDHPAVVSFYYERGVDVTDLPYWELQALARDYEEAVLTEDPWTASVTVEAEGDRLRLTLDDRLEVTAADRLRE